MRHNTFTLAVISITCFLIIPQQTFAQEVLTKVNGGVSWQTLLAGGRIYNGSGSLSSNTAVSQGNFNLDFIQLEVS